MKSLIAILALVLTLYSCNSSKSVMSETSTADVESPDAVRIANDSLEYEIIIIDPGFKNWLVTQPPQGYYGLSFLEGKNRLFVTEYNRRVRNFQIYDRRLYEQEINYEFDVDYGLEVNYLLYNYFMYFQKTYNQSFVGGRRGKG